MNTPPFTVVWDGTSARENGKYLAPPIFDVPATYPPPSHRLVPDSISGRVRRQLQDGDYTVDELAETLKITRAQVEHALHYLLNRTQDIVKKGRVEQRHFSRPHLVDVRYGLRGLEGVSR